MLRALADRDHEAAGQVVLGDDRVDEIYLPTETRILKALALQAPVAKDLRLVSAIMHSNMHVERMGDLCVNIAKFVQRATNLILVARYLERFGDHCVDVVEQVAFLVTGVFREFTDASHPERDTGLTRAQGPIHG